MIYSVSRFNLGGLKALFGGISPPVGLVRIHPHDFHLFGITNSPTFPSCTQPFNQLLWKFDTGAVFYASSIVYLAQMKPLHQKLNATHTRLRNFLVLTSYGIINLPSGTLRLDTETVA